MDRDEVRIGALIETDPRGLLEEMSRLEREAFFAADRATKMSRRLGLVEDIATTAVNDVAHLVAAVVALRHAEVALARDGGSEARVARDQAWRDLGEVLARVRATCEQDVERLRGLGRDPRSPHRPRR